jgi:hypothetical protein
MAFWGATTAQPQELGIIALIKRGVRVLTANGDDLTDSSDPSRKMMRQTAGSFTQYEKARLVAKLKAARKCEKARDGKCEGRKTWPELDRSWCTRQSDYDADLQKDANGPCATSPPSSPSLAI